MHKKDNTHSTIRVKHSQKAIYARLQSNGGMNTKVASMPEKVIQLLEDWVIWQKELDFASKPLFFSRVYYEARVYSGCVLTGTVLLKVDFLVAQETHARVNSGKKNCRLKDQFLTKRLGSQDGSHLTRCQIYQRRRRFSEKKKRGRKKNSIVLISQRTLFSLFAGKLIPFSLPLVDLGQPRSLGFRPGGPSELTRAWGTWPRSRTRF